MYLSSQLFTTNGYETVKITLKREKMTLLEIVLLVLLFTPEE